MLSQQLSISSWSLHRCLGPLRWTVWNEETRTQEIKIEEQPSQFELLDLPRIAAERGLTHLELCHFHFPARDEAYLVQLRRAFEQSEVKFHTLLVDYGDISSPDATRRQSDIHYLKEWIDTAHISGASAIRIVAGEQPAGDEAAISRSIEAIKELQAYANDKQVLIVTENFRELTSTLTSWSSFISAAPAPFHTIVDFGNLAKHEREEGIRYGATFAHSFHAKPEYTVDGEIDKEAFFRLLDILKELQCHQPISIIFDRKGNMWDGIERVKEMIQSFDRL